MTLENNSASNTQRINVLFSSCGRRVELIQCFRDAAKKLNIELHAIAVDMHPHHSSACHEADVSFKAPPCSNPDFIPTISEICKNERASHHSNN